MNHNQEDGIDAVSRQFLRYDQVTKEQSYRLAEQEGKEDFDDGYQIKTCDLDLFLNGNDEERRHFASLLGKAMKDIGFAILVGHGLDSAIYKEAHDLVNRVFTETSLEQRISYKAQRFGSVNQGYFPIKTTSDIHPDLVEGWVFCRRAFNFDHSPDFDETQFWPLPDCEPVFRRYVEQAQKLFRPMMQAILMSLNCDPHLYDQKLEGTNFGLRLNYYPPLSAEQQNSGAGRILGHEDVDLFTLLPAPEIEGLQVLNRRNNKWVRLNAPPGSIILNTGDYMQRITNDTLPSTTHRVSQPRDKQLLGKARISLPLAAYVWENEILEVLPGLGAPKYEPIKAIHFHTRTTSKFYGDDYAVQE